jgi:hypothetical protein
MARPLMAPPDVPAERLAALREAFDATMKDTHTWKRPVASASTSIRSAAKGSRS